MLQRLLIKALISFVIAELEKFREQLDWAKLQKNVDDFVRKIVPGTWFDDQAVKLVDSVFLAIKDVLSKGSTIKTILDLLAQRKYAEAVEMLKQLIIGEIGHVEVQFSEVLHPKLLPAFAGAMVESEDEQHVPAKLTVGEILA